MGCEETPPPDSLITRQEISHRGDIRQGVLACCAGDRHRPEPAGSDIFYCRGHDRKGDINLSTKQVCDCRSPAAIRHMRHVETGHRLEQLAGQMVRSTEAGRCYADLTGVSLGISDGSGNGLGPERRVYDHDIGHTDDVRYGGDVADKIEAQLLK